MWSPVPHFTAFPLFWQCHVTLVTGSTVQYGKIVMEKTQTDQSQHY
uniref:Uncharacterized protein n=1 Tax=Anguilla anguilla TaxID=7936 RepID=A0A0E9QVE9_ANGAN